MSPRAWQERVRDILLAMEHVEEDLAGLNLDAFMADGTHVRAVAFDLMAIGEAASHVPQDVQARAPAVPWAEMRAVRNKIAHEYYLLNPRIVWDTATNDLPPLVARLRAVLSTDT
jgi:uncharacterized protein with HEPN domain